MLKKMIFNGDCVVYQGVQYILCVKKHNLLEANFYVHVSIPGDFELVISS